MAGEFTLRSATIKDAPKIAELSGQLGYPAESPEIASRLGELGMDGSHHIAVAQSENGEVLGWVHVMTITHLESGRFAEIVGLVVDAPHRGKGIGEALVRNAETWAASRDCSIIVVRSNVLRTETHRFYEGLGYTVAKQQKVFKKLM
jgi:GNAT superfamily N-acetyltransferase